MHGRAICYWKWSLHRREFERRSSAYSVEKLDDRRFRAVCMGTSTITEAAIVDPEPI